MGAYPFLSRVEAYLRECRKPNKDTLKERERKLRMLERVYREIREADPKLAADPKRFDEREIGAVLDWMVGQRFGTAYQVKLVQYLRLLLRHLGNPILDRIKEADRDALPRPSRKVLHAPAQDEIQDILNRLESVSGWRGAVLRFATQVHYQTGLRVKELRLAAVRDLDLKGMYFTVMHPKGEGKWADAGQRVKMPESLRVVIEDFLDVRARELRAEGLDPNKVEPLIPATGGQHYTDAGWRNVRLKVFKELGLKNNFRELRPGHAMLLKRSGVSIEAVSKRLRHTNTATTEAFYARIEDTQADDECIKALESKLVANR